MMNCSLTLVAFAWDDSGGLEQTFPGDANLWAAGAEHLVIDGSTETEVVQRLGGPPIGVEHVLAQEEVRPIRW